MKELLTLRDAGNSTKLARSSFASFLGKRQMAEKTAMSLLACTSRNTISNTVLLNHMLSKKNIYTKKNKRLQPAEKARKAAALLRGGAKSVDMRLGVSELSHALAPAGGAAPDILATIFDR